ncbi:MAG: GNAT family N-acetyltransferase [Bacteroidetes bacterium]|nr:GNAT family N-acetyltransferase [Bacteroidota bacterium]
MIINGYGVTLVRIRHEHIELVRNYRNSERIRSFMEFREEITPEMQEEWFCKINNRNHGFYLIEHDGKFIGMVNGRDIDWEKKTTGSGGIFIWDESWWNTAVPVAAVMLLIEISFILGLEYNYIRVLRHNTHAIDFNRQLGYRLLPGQDEAENQEYLLTRETYFESMASLRRFLQKRFGTSFTCTISNEQDDMAQHLFQLAAGFTPEQQAQFIIQRA